MKPLNADGLKIAAGVVVLLAFLFLVYAAVFRDIEGREIVVLLIGIVTGNMGTMFNYFFGSTKESGEKTRMMAKMKPDDHQ